MQSRAALQQAVNVAFKATSVSERKAAAEMIAEALKVYVSSEDVMDAEPDLAVGSMRIRTQRLLGERKTPFSTMSDELLTNFNDALPWSAMTVDSTGRIVGSAWSSQKRNSVAPLLDRRLEAFNEVFPLKDKTALEVGCFEGIHTLGLCLLGAKVIAADGRVENALKTMARTWLYGERPEIVLWDFENLMPPTAPEAWDMLHHIGVLYHLSNPVEHLQEVLPRTRGAVLLDTHVANNEAQAVMSYDVRGKTYRYRRKDEPYADTSPFAGMRDHAKYLLVEDLMDVVRECGFSDVRLADDRDERNGRRVTIWAFR